MTNLSPMTQPVRHILDTDLADVGDGLRRVLALRQIAERGLVHGDAEERALALDMIDYLDTGDEGGLEAALGLAGPGHTGALRQYRQARRDEALCRLWRTCWPDLSAKAAAAQIAQHWRREAALRCRVGDAQPDEPCAILRRLIDMGHDPLAAETIPRILGHEVGHLDCVDLPSQSHDLE